MSATMKMSYIYPLYLHERNNFSYDFQLTGCPADSMYMYNHHAQLRVLKQFEQNKLNLLEL